MCPASHRKPYPSDVSDEKWSLVVSYLTLMTEAAPQLDHLLRDLFNALRYVIRYALPGGLCQTTSHLGLPCISSRSAGWPTAVSTPLAQDLAAVLRLAGGRAPDPTAAIIDSRTLRSTPGRGTRAGYDGAKRKCGSKVHMAFDTLGHLLALQVTPADVGDRTAVGRLCADIQDATEEEVQLAYVDQGYTGEAAAWAAAAEGIALHFVKLPDQVRFRPATAALGRAAQDSACAARGKAVEGIDTALSSLSDGGSSSTSRRLPLSDLPEVDLC